jgi:hypothetical protein
VASQLLDELEIESPETFLLRDILPGAAWAPFGPEPCDLPSDMDFASEALIAEENCPRGILVAICLEAVAGLCIYGSWHAFKLFH